MRIRWITAALALLAGSSLLLAEPKALPRVKMDDVLYKVGPRYPQHLRRSRIGGAGLFQMIIDFKTGKVTDVVVVKSTGQDPLDREAILALRQWRFKPGRVREGTIPITFSNGSEPVVLPPGTKIERGN